MKPIISPEELKALLGQVILLDARSGKGSEMRYKTSHVNGALHVDLDRDLTQKVINPANGGRHPLPEPIDFAALLGNLGISPDSRVVIYDDKAGANAAARLWWMMKAAGHEKTQVVDGGWDAFQKNNFPLSPDDEPASTKAGPYPFTDWKLPMLTMDQVEEFVKNKDNLLIDVRESYRYRGESEPIDLVAGHIPGATNIPYIENLQADGKFLDAETLRAKYQSIIGSRNPRNVVVNCGSGVTACHTLLALEQAGVTGVGLYVGSWSEWSRNEKPIAKGNDD